MPKIKKDELEKVMNSIYKPKQRVLPANQKKPARIDSVEQIHSSKPIVYLIDGYNLMYKVEKIAKIAETDLISARDKIIDIVCDFQGYSGAECVLVFDAYRNNVPIPVVTKDYNIALVYTKANQTADMYIEQKSQELNDKYKIYVVTSDALEQLRIFSNNALRISSTEFMKKYETYQNRNKKTDVKAKHQPLKELRKLLFED